MFELACPLALLLLPLPWVINYFLPEAPQAHHAVLRTPFYLHLKKMAAEKHRLFVSTKKIPTKLLYLCWLCLILAATGPKWLGKPIEVKRRAHNIMMALDISGSMQIPDMEYLQQPVDRLRLVKYVASEFVNARKNDRLGLILFGSRAYLQTPLTFDKKTLNHMLNDATIGLAGPQTALGDAIGLAIKRLKKTDEKDRILILLTDGANNAGVLDPIQAAKIAAESHIKIYTIGLGASRFVVPGLLGSQVINPSQDLDLNTLKQIAKQTNGLFFRAKNSQDLKNVYKTIDKLVPTISKNGVYRPAQELFIYPLLLAILISIGLACRHLNFRWNRLVNLVRQTT